MTEKFVCLICKTFGIEGPFITEESEKVGDHIWYEHNQNQINMFVTRYGGGWKKIES